MAKLFISDRANFPPGKQTAFLREVVSKIGTANAVNISRVSRRTFVDWKRGKYSFPFATALALSKHSGVPLPRRISVRSLTTHLRNIAARGGLRLLQLKGRVGGSEKKRLEGWKNWWNTKGKHDSRLITHARHISKPKRDDKLAEFVGIMLGDGGVAPYHISITLNSVRDREYAEYVRTLIFKLFKTEARTYKRQSERTLNIVVHRKSLAEYCSSIGLPLGNKLAVSLDIPNWIKRKHNLSLACIRGLIDTDGSIFHHSYTSARKKYHYIKISFSSASYALLDSVEEILRKNGISARKSYTFREVRLDSQKSVERYMRLVGTHNPKHLQIWGKGEVA